MYVFYNGKLVEKENVLISPFDHGFLYGLGLFETFRMYHGHPFLLDDHLNRLNQGLKKMNIELKLEREEVVDALRMVLEANELENAYVRLNISAGEGEIGLQTIPYDKPNWLIFVKPLPVAKGFLEKDALIVKVSRNTPEADERLKSHHYLNNMVAKREIGANPNLEGIFLTREGYLAEGIVSNVFWVKDAVLYTPSIETGILNGITRQFICELATILGVEVKEGLFVPEVAMEADEMFVTNSIQEIVRIRSFAGKQLPSNQHAMISELQTYYRQYCNTLWSRQEIKKGRV